MMANSATSSTEWVDLILSEGDAGKVWQSVCARLLDFAVETSKPSVIDKATILPDRLLAESAWNLWEEFPNYAPNVVNELKKFWVKTSTAGTAVLLLDALSLRELYWIVAGAREREIEPARIEAFGSAVPTETEPFAAALGLPSRSKLFNNEAPASFVFAGEDAHTDVLDAPFADCVSLIPSQPRVFVWHKWPDFPLIDENGRKHQDAPEIAARETKNQLTSDGFWSLVDRLRQGRRLVISSDHGYAVRKSFSSEIKDNDSVKLLRETFGARRSAVEKPDKPWPRRHLPPLVCRHNGYLVVMGQRWWAVQGGFPSLCHGGLSLLEAVVPFVELPAL